MFVVSEDILAWVGTLSLNFTLVRLNLTSTKQISLLRESLEMSEETSWTQTQLTGVCV